MATAVADEINHNVGAELIAVFGRHAGDADDGIDILATYLRHNDSSPGNQDLSWIRARTTVRR